MFKCDTNMQPWVGPAESSSSYDIHTDRLNYREGFLEGVIWALRMIKRAHRRNKQATNRTVVKKG